MASPAPTLAGRTALVTGAAGGIGRAFVARLAADGARVLALDVDKEQLAALAADEARVEPVVADLRDLDALDEVVAEIVTGLGGVDVLVNNAGRQHVAPVERFPPEVFAELLVLMLEAPFRLTRLVLPHMYARGWGRIVNVSSVHGLRASPFKSAYVAAKHGLEGLSKVVALEGVAHGVTSNCVSPGYVRTQLVEHQLVGQAAAHGVSEREVLDSVLLAPAAVKRLVEPAEVAELAAVLWGPASASITGSTLVQDGGWTAR